MFRAQLLSAAALGAALLATPALAQSSNAIQEMQRERANPATPWVPAQNQNAAEADAMGRQDAGRWLTQAEAALRRGRTGEAVELLERAETRLLTRSTLAATADQPYRGPIVDRIAEARRALMQRDREAAMQSIASARSSLQAGGDMATGGSAGMAPAMGGGSGMAPGMGGSSGMMPSDHGRSSLR